MNIELKKVKYEKQEMKWLKHLFVTAFPPEERPPFFIMRWRASVNVDWWKIIANNEDAGFFYVVKHENLVYVFFFAVDAHFRGKHIGTEALKMLIKRYYGKILFLAIEQIDEDAPNLQERINRKNFYLRCGLTEMHKKVKEASVLYELLGIGGTINNADYQALIKNWLGLFLSKLVKMEVLD